MAQRAIEFGTAICEALGIDPKGVSRLCITASANDLLRIEVDILPTIPADKFAGIIDALRADSKVVKLDMSVDVIDVTGMGGNSYHVLPAWRLRAGDADAQTL